MAPAGDGKITKKRNISGVVGDDAVSTSHCKISFDEKLWTTSQETILDIDIDDYDDERGNCDDDVERQSKDGV